MQNQKRTDSATTEIAAANLSKTIRLHLEILDCRFLLPTLEFFMHAKIIPAHEKTYLNRFI